MIEATNMDNLMRCTRCHRLLIAEEYATHNCDFRDIPLQDCEQILVDHMTDCGADKNGDGVVLGWGLDGTLYRLIVCKHKEPHFPMQSPIRPPRGNAIVPGGVGSLADSSVNA
jgi:hypothetical protein